MKTFEELKALIEKRGVHAEFGEPGEGWGIEQSSYELATFLVRMQELGVQSVLEIGTGYKAGLAHFLGLDMAWNVVSCDIQDYGHEKRVPHELTYFKVLTPDWYPYTKSDLVFIDGNHEYEAVKADYEFWGQYATKVIAFHDTEGLRNCEGVKQLWHELMLSNLGKKWGYAVAAYNDKRSGIGWIEL